MVGLLKNGESTLYSSLGPSAVVVALPLVGAFFVRGFFGAGIDFPFLAPLAVAVVFFFLVCREGWAVASLSSLYT